MIEGVWSRNVEIFVLKARRVRVSFPEVEDLCFILFGTIKISFDVMDENIRVCIQTEYVWTKLFTVLLVPPSHFFYPRTGVYWVTFSVNARAQKDTTSWNNSGILQLWASNICIKNKYLKCCDNDNVYLVPFAGITPDIFRYGKVIWSLGSTACVRGWA